LLLEKEPPVLIGSETRWAPEPFWTFWKREKYFVGFEVLTAVIMKSSVLWDITLCRPLEVKLSCACHLLHTGFLLGFFFDPEDGGDMFLRNVGVISHKI
jgi:hypothetical protein